MIGRQLRVRRQQLLLSQDTLARRAGVDVKTVRNIESGRTTARPSTVRLLSAALVAAALELSSEGWLPVPHAARQLAEAFAAPDATALAQLDPAGREEQLRARQVLHDYVDRMSLNPAAHDPDVVDGLRYLSRVLVAQACTCRAVACSANDCVGRGCAGE